MIISYSLECFVCNKHIDGLIIAIDPKWKRILEDETNSFDIPIHLLFQEKVGNIRYSMR